MSEENKKIPNLSEETYIKIMNEIYSKISEERDLSIDRYRLQDEQIEDEDDFILQGKIAIAYLTHASTRTDALLNMTKEMKSIIFKEGSDDSSNSSAAVSDAKRRMMAEMIKKVQNQKEESEDLESDEDLINNVPDKDDLEDKE